MRKVITIAAFLLLAVFAASPSLLLKVYFYTEEVFYGAQSVFVGFILEPKETIKEVRFVGDVMLARHVEILMDKDGSDYPYQNLSTPPRTVWVGNFEASAPDTHEPTKPFTLDLSVDTKHLNALYDFGMTHVSLANNHSLDFGREGLAETRSNLSSFTTFGHPNMVSAASVSQIELDEGLLGILAIHAVGSSPDDEKLTNVLHKLTLETDAQVAFVHWGEEYTTTHNKSQEDLARRLIDGGIDAVIGHHPHVVQDIDTYNGKPIFYSLGNFIFDQYFDQSVQEGLVVAVTLEDEGINYRLLPVTSVGSLSAPRLMDESEAEYFLATLAANSNSRIRTKIAEGMLSLWRN